MISVEKGIFRLAYEKVFYFLKRYGDSVPDLILTYINFQGENRTRNLFVGCKLAGN